MRYSSIFCTRPYQVSCLSFILFGIVFFATLIRVSSHPLLALSLRDNPVDFRQLLISLANILFLSLSFTRTCHTSHAYVETFVKLGPIRVTFYLFVHSAYQISTSYYLCYLFLFRVSDFLSVLFPVEIFMYVLDVFGLFRCLLVVYVLFVFQFQISVIIKIIITL